VSLSPTIRIRHEHTKIYLLVVSNPDTRARGSPIVCLRLEGDGPRVEQFELLLKIAAGCGAWHNAGDDDSAILGWLLLVSLPVCGSSVVLSHPIFRRKPSATYLYARI
jgi:hypothetical protein